MDKYMRLTPEILQQLKSMSREEFDAYTKNLSQALRSRSAEVIAEAVRLGVMTSDEYVTCYKGRYPGALGYDSFFEYIGTVIHCMNKKISQDDMVFITNNQHILEDKEKLSQRFGILIISTVEMQDQAR